MAAGVGTLAFFVYVTEHPEPVKVTPVDTVAGFTIKKISIDGLTRVKFTDAMKAETLTAKDPSGFVRLSLVQTNATDPTKKDVVTAEKMMTLMAPAAPSYLVRALSDEYTIGVRIGDTNSMFLILSTDSFDNSFAGMLEWEKNMSRDLAFMSQKTLPENLGFKDIVIRNKDVRVLYDSIGAPFLLYSFIDKKTIVIATDDATLNDVSQKLINFRSVR
ncbi:hypothetical protein KW783_03225 [Candidatus Parcubacteria bacterium]|nr:hypothetical protein [Candidatus Parcubacteria bacterium]